MKVLENATSTGTASLCWFTCPLIEFKMLVVKRKVPLQPPQHPINLFQFHFIASSNFLRALKTMHPSIIHFALHSKIHSIFISLVFKWAGQSQQRPSNLYTPFFMRDWNRPVMNLLIQIVQVNLLNKN